MKWMFKYTDEETGKEVTLHFLRTLNTEKMYRDDLSYDHPVEMLADLTEVYKVMNDIAGDGNDSDTSTEAIHNLLDLRFSDTCHDVLQYMYAEVKDGKLVQDKSTRKKFDKYNFSYIAAISAFFQRLA